MEKILIIDDEDLVRSALCRVLSKDSYEILTARNGLEGLKILEKQQFKVIILDLKMPQMDGLEFLRQINTQGTNLYSVIVLTGYGTDQDIEECYQLGIQTFLRKPVNIFELKGALNRTFYLIQAAEALNQEIAAKEKAHDLLKRTFDGIAAGVMTLDQFFCVKMISEKACKLLEITEEKALNKPAVNILGTTVAGVTGELFENSDNPDETFEIITEILSPSQKIIPIALSILPLEDASAFKGWLLFFRDLRKVGDPISEKGKIVTFGRMVSGNSTMKSNFEIIDLTAPSSAGVMIDGETGTGKELVAREIHDRSPRAAFPFHAVNCVAITPSLMESDFFGHERGAFTGAIRTKKGRFEVADKGTLFLDEVGEIPLELQGKLLRVLQDQTFERVGGTKTIKVDVRIVAATNRNLQEMVHNGQFREDLYYRLHVVPIHLPPLRERMTDIPLLIALFIDELNKKESRDVKRLSADALRQLYQYSWPGNIRELFHAIEYAFAVGKGTVIEKKHLPNTIPEEIDPITLPVNEKEMIVKALQRTNFSKPKAAALLGIHRTSLYRKLKKYKLTDTLTQDSSL